MNNLQNNAKILKTTLIRKYQPIIIKLYEYTIIEDKNAPRRLKTLCSLNEYKNMSVKKKLSLSPEELEKYNLTNKDIFKKELTSVAYSVWNKFEKPNMMETLNKYTNTKNTFLKALRARNKDYTLINNLQKLYDYNIIDKNLNKFIDYNTSLINKFNLTNHKSFNENIIMLKEFKQEFNKKTVYINNKLSEINNISLEA